MEPISTLLDDDDTSTGSVTLLLLEEATFTLLLDFAELLLDTFTSFEDDKAEDDTATFWLLLDSGAELGMTEEEDSALTLDEEFALPLLLLDPTVPSELQDDEKTLLEDAILTLLLDPLPSVEDDKAEDDAATFRLLLDSGSEPGVTEEEDLSLTLEEVFALPLLLLDSSRFFVPLEEDISSPSGVQSPSMQV